MKTKTCPYCAEDIKDAAIKCRFCGSYLTESPRAREWYRDLDSKMLGGVCSGLARQFGISATALRVGFIIAAFVGGWGLLIYVALWIIMPIQQRPTESAPASMPPALPELPVEPSADSQADESESLAQDSVDADSEDAAEASKDDETS